MSDVGADLGASYRTVRERLTDYARSLNDAELETNVPGCPLWRVRDVLAHTTGAAADFHARNFEAAPGPTWTARHVDARRDKAVAEILDEWSTVGPLAEADLDSTLPLPPAVADVVTHEQDILGALGQSGYRDDPILRWTAAWAVGGIGERLVREGVPALLVRTESRDLLAGEGSPGATLDTTDFEFVRVVFGRRSEAQIEAMAWHGDPAPYLKHLNTFAPSELDVIE